MNKQRVQGTIAFLQLSTGERNGKQWKKASWTLCSKHGNNFNNINCSTFDWEIIDSLFEGMEIELTDYLPVNKSFKKENPMTGLEEKKTFFTLEVYDFVPLGNDKGSEKMFKQVLNSQQPLQMQVQTQVKQPKFDLEKAFEESKHSEVNGALDWLEELKAEETKVASPLSLEELEKMNTEYTSQIEQDKVIEVDTPNEKNPW